MRGVVLTLLAEMMIFNIYRLGPAYSLVERSRGTLRDTRNPVQLPPIIYSGRYPKLETNFGPAMDRQRLFECPFSSVHHRRTIHRLGSPIEPLRMLQRSRREREVFFSGMHERSPFTIHRCARMQVHGRRRVSGVAFRF